MNIKFCGDDTIKQIVCENCNGSYELQPGESLDDFVSCECGGTLRYAEFDGEYPESETKTLSNIQDDGNNSNGNIISNYSNGLIVGVLLVIGGLLGWILGYNLMLILIILGIALTILTYNKNRHRIKRSNINMAVSKYLNELSKNYIILNDVTIPGRRGYLDHVLVGSKGIFVIEPKHYSGSLIIDGKEWFYKNGQNTRKAYGNPGDKIQINTRSLIKYLSSQGLSTFDRSTYPIMAFVNPNLTIRNKPRHYDVMHPSNLQSYIQSRKTEIPEEDVYKAVNLLTLNSAEMLYIGDQFQFQK